MRLPIDSQMWAHAASCTPYWASNETQNRCSPITRKAGLSKSPNPDAGVHSAPSAGRSILPLASLRTGPILHISNTNPQKPVTSPEFSFSA